MADMTTPALSLRAAALIIHGDQILLIHHEQLGCFYTIGGGIEPGESSEEAVRRECREETGLPFEPDRLVFVQERFYQADGVPRHEITFFYLMNALPAFQLHGQLTDQPSERMLWVPLSMLGQIRLLPAFLADALQPLPGPITHIITRE